jgi:hypothetical protein
MRHPHFSASALVALFVLSCPGLAADAAKTTAAPNKSVDASGAFEVLKGLEGSWVGEAVVVRDGQSKAEGTKSPAKITFKTIANGTSVTATFAEATPVEMVSVFHQDGKNKLIHTHYCAVGNQPTMVFHDSDEPGLIRFLFASGTNMDVDKDRHVHNTSFRLVDDDTLETETDLWGGGKRTSVRYSKLVRQK